MNVEQILIGVCFTLNIMGDCRIVRTLIRDKGYGFIASKFIKAGEVVLQEKPILRLSVGKDSGMLRSVYCLSMSRNKEDWKGFMQLSPVDIGLEEAELVDRLIEMDYKCLKKQRLGHQYVRLKQLYDEHDLRLLCLKYIRNAFNYGDDVAILLKGAVFNHSCCPNVIYRVVEGCMHYIAARDIRVGEELCDHYGSLSEDKVTRQKRLLKFYGFWCDCERCGKEK